MKLRLVIEIDLKDYENSLENQQLCEDEILENFKENIEEDKETFIDELNMWCDAKEISFDLM